VSPILPGLRALAGRYDLWLVDLWGVIHDGERPFPGVPEALAALRGAGARVVFLSNSSRLGELLAANLAGMGIERALFERVVSSGDVTRAALVGRDPAIFGALSPRPRTLHLGDRGYVPWLFEPDVALDFIDDVAGAELVVTTGTVRTDEELARTKARLAPAAARGVPLVCTNPDPIVPTHAGVKLGPGAIAQAYADLGGPTFLYGKPHAPIYRHALGGAPARVVAIGDLLETDVRGARGAGIASVLVTATGVHAARIGEPPDPGVVEALAAEADAWPDAVVARFRW
jgi:HAD superfamily hydrolase (TIGR01459 family)